MNKLTEDVLAYLLNTVAFHLDRHVKNFARCFFISFTCAFNTISLTILTHQLMNMELHSNIRNLVYSFMTDRSQRVITNAGVADSRTTNINSPQECVLSSALFFLYIKDMPILDYGSYHLIKYADDTILPELLGKFVPSILPSAVSELIDWFQFNELVLNVRKTKELIISNMRDNPTCDSLVIDGTAVEQVDSFKYLSTVFDKKLNFKANTQAVVKKPVNTFSI